MSDESKKNQLRLSEFEFEQDRYNKNNKIIYNTLYLAVAISGAVIPLSQHPLFGENGYPGEFTIWSLSLAFFMLGAIVFHYRRRRSDLIESMRTISSNIVEDYSLQTFQDDTRKLGSARILQTSYIGVGLILLVIYYI